MFTSKIKSKSIITIVMALCACALAVCGLSACQLQTNTQVNATLDPQLDSSATITPGVLTVGINTANAPYGGVNSDNETVGLDVDVAAAVAQELGLKLQIVDVSASGRNALNNAQIDVALGLTKSGTSDKISYSDSYITDGLSLFCLATNKPVSIEDVVTQVNAGTAKILVQADTTAAMKVVELLGVEKAVAMPTMQTAFDALERGEELYLVTDAVVGDYFSRNYSDIIRMGFLGADCVTPIYAVTLSQNSALSNGVNGAVKTINANGVMRVIAAKWLGPNGDTLLAGKTDISQLPAKAFEQPEDQNQQESQDQQQTQEQEGQ